MTEWSPFLEQYRNTYGFNIMRVNQIFGSDLPSHMWPEIESTRKWKGRSLSADDLVALRLLIEDKRMNRD